jgi:hypothetical protein
MALLVAPAVLGLSITDGEFWSSKAIMAHKANFSLGHFLFLEYIVFTLNKSECKLEPNQQNSTTKNTESTKKTRKIKSFVPFVVN